MEPLDKPSWTWKELFKMYGRGRGDGKHRKGHIPPARWKSKNRRGKK